VALKCGDSTGRDLGRITLNPIPHIDLFMTVILPVVLILGSGGRFAFGGAKPVPVNYYNLRHPLRDMALVALAGPVSNLLLAVFFYACLRFLVVQLGVWQADQLGPAVLNGAVWSNLFLATFNLLPIPPLDGSRVMTWLLPSGIREPYARLESMGLLLVMFLVLFVSPVKTMVIETVQLLYSGLEHLVSLGGLW
jgi:Zn-dependent protease